MAAVDPSLEQFDSPWKEFVKTGKPVRGIRGEIVLSWQRCLTAGVDPYQKAAKVVYAPSEIEAITLRNRQLLDAALPVMHQLHEFVRGSGFLIALADREGTILECIGDDEVVERCKKGNAVKGANWSEESAGTNAIGTCLLLNKPVQIYSYEHFCLCSRRFTCSGSPIHDPDGNIIGVLDITGTYDRVHNHTLGMAVIATQAIENHLRLTRISSYYQVANSFKNAVIDSIAEGLLTTDEAGRITLANRTASNLLRSGSRRTLLGTLITDVLGHGNKVLLEALAGRQELTDYEANLTTGAGQLRCTVTFRPIMVDGQSRGLVIALNEIKRARKLVQHMSGAEAYFTFDDLIGNNKDFQKAVKLARAAANSSSNVLILGESGTGKDLLAQAIHNESNRRGSPFVAINCAAIPRELIGSELFGYVEGAFTGARKGGNAGKFELAEGGTIFLDEIGEMPVDLQTTLLRVLEQKAVMRIGGHNLIPVDVRVIAATNKDLRREVEKGNFRQDLFYRLNVVTIELPPLRQRKDDIHLLVNHFLEKYNKQFHQKVTRISEPAWESILEYDWPGNIRELQNVIERALNIADGPVLDLDNLPDELRANRDTVQETLLEHGNIINPPPVCQAGKSSGAETGGYSNIRELEIKTILHLLDRYGGNVTRVAEELGVARSTIYRKLRKYDCGL